MRVPSPQVELATAPRRITILGSTGSVGSSTLDLIARNRDAYVVEALTANGNADLLATQARRIVDEVAKEREIICMVATAGTTSSSSMSAASRGRTASTRSRSRATR